MGVFAAAAAAIFGDPNVAHDGVYRPKGAAAVALSVARGEGVVLTAAEETAALLTTGLRGRATVADVSRAAVPARPADGDGLEVTAPQGTRRFTIRAAEPDGEATRWRLDLDETTGGTGG